MKKLKSLMWVAAFACALLAVLALSKPSLEKTADDLHKESAERVEANTKHCEARGKIYVRESVWDRGECMTPEEALAALIRMKKDLDNQGLK